MLPKGMRDRIWAAYVPGQEITKTPSAAYLAVAREAEQFARSSRCESGATGSARAEPPPQGALF
jgi:hypothetical protein